MDNSQSTKTTSESSFQKIPKKSFSVKSSDELLTQGNNYLELGRIDDAFKCYENAYNILQNETDIIGEGYALTGIGFIHEKRRKYTDAKKYYELSFKKFKEAKDKRRSKKVSKLLANLLLTIADEKIKAEELKEAEDNYREASKYYIGSKDTIGEGYALTGLGIVYGKYEEYEESRSTMRML